MGIGIPHYQNNFERMGLHTHLPIDHFKKSLLLDIVHKRHLAFFTNNNVYKNCKKQQKCYFCDSKQMGGTPNLYLEGTRPKATHLRHVLH